MTHVQEDAPTYMKMLMVRNTLEYKKIVTRVIPTAQFVKLR